MGDGKEDNGGSEKAYPGVGFCACKAVGIFYHNLAKSRLKTPLKSAFKYCFRGRSRARESRRGNVL